jgi:hypothetical protein
MLAQLNKLWSLVNSWWRVNSIATSLPLPQALILLELTRQLEQLKPGNIPWFKFIVDLSEPGSIHYNKLMTPVQLYECLPLTSRGKWHEFIEDLGVLNQRLLISYNGEISDRILISPYGIQLAEEHKKHLYV